MKQVFKNHSEVCHIFAQQNQEEGRAGNISFRNNEIYSYHWWVMAKFVKPDLILVRDWSYSSSTGKHLSYLRGAISHINKIYVSEPDNLISSVNSLISTIKDSYNNFETKRNKREYFSTNQYAFDVLTELNKEGLISMPDIAHYLISEEPVYMNDLYLYDQKVKVKEELKRKKEEERRERINNFLQSEEPKRLRNLWLNNQSNDKYYYSNEFGSIKLFNYIALRPNKDKTEIETTLGASVPIRDAKILFDRIMQGKDIKGFKIGHYTVIGINGTLKIGCHDISKEEIKRLSELLNW